MSLKLYLDEQIPAEITARLQAAGVDVLTTQEDGCCEFPDAELLDRATSLGREMVTQDQDFLTEAARRQREGVSFCGVFFAAQHKPMNRVYAEWLEMYAKLENSVDVAGRVIFVP